jgi:hypothetical protein
MLLTRRFSMVSINCFIDSSTAPDGRFPHDRGVAAAREFKGVMQSRPIRDCTGHLLGEILWHPASVSASRYAAFPFGRFLSKTIVC